MPSQPPSPYDRDFDFEQFSQLTPNAQQPGQEINQELDALASSVNQTISRLGEIQRDDGKLKDGIFDFAPMNNAVIEAQSARDDAVAAKVEAVAAKDYITVTASGLEASVALTAAAANASKNLSLYHANQAGTYATQSAVSAIAAANSASSAAATATNAMNFSASASNSAAAAAGSATSAANSLTSITTGLLSKLTNSINWTGAYDNGVTYQAGDGVIFGGEYFVLKAYIGAAGYDPAAYASSWTKLIPAGVGGNPFDQSLNTTDTANFYQLYTSGSLGSFVAANDYTSLVGQSIQSNGSVGTLTISADQGITFPDATVQTTAYTGPTNPFDQSLNIGDAPSFGSLTITDASVNLTLSGAIQFGDSTYQTTAFPPEGGTTSQYIDGTGALQTMPTMEVASRLETTVYNKTGSTIPKHSVVYIDGAHGNDPAVALAQASTETTSRSAFAFTKDDIPDQSLGTVVQAGLLEGVNTGGYVDGDLIFLSPSVAGGWTSTQPYSPNHYVLLGTVVRAHTTQGTIQVKITNSNELDELSDVQVQGALEGDYLVKSGPYWVPQAIPSASTTTAGKVELATDAEAIAGTSTTLAVTPAAGMAVVDAQRVDIQTFGSPTTSGSFTWTKPAGAKFVRAYLIGGGGGGGSGARRETSVARGGANGGLGGSVAVYDIPAELLGSTETVTVGAGSLGGAGKTNDNTFGNAGSAPTPSTFGKYRTGTGASATAGSDILLTVQSGVFYTYGLFQSAGSSNGRGNISTGIAGSNYPIPICTFGGGGGGGNAAGATSSAGGANGGAKIASAGSNAGTSDAIAGGTAGGGNPLTDGGNGADSTIIGLGGSGGGGGGHNFSGTASNGGDGGWPGGGGGGGGASDNGFTSGAGGKGANGAVIVITFF